MEITVRIEVKGHLSNGWVDWLGVDVMRHHDDGRTELVGVFPDQAALHGLLARIRDLGMPLLSLSVLEEPFTDAR